MEREQREREKGEREQREREQKTKEIDSADSGAGILTPYNPWPNCPSCIDEHQSEVIGPNTML